MSCQATPHSKPSIWRFNMSEPLSMEEYLKRFSMNQKIEGFGIGNVYCTIPCPFCAAPGFMRYEVLQVESVMRQEHICKECKRGARALFMRLISGIQFEIVQTCGPDQPTWLVPKMRRLDDPGRPVPHHGSGPDNLK